ncbi:peroxisomal biogenesis factor 3 [Planococcus citri]|uniref:peroxisomal biogenesis factor 3 n=1 Tax=Planococcus citri TaxID=170843 RepID=UPI0031F73EFC
MDFFGSLKTFLYNHRRKFLISGIAVGGGVALFNYVRYQLQKQEKLEATEFFETIRRQKHFESLEITCHQTIINLGNRLQKQILQLLDIDAIVSQLKSKPADSLKLWQDLKLYTFTEICLMVYAQVLLVLVLKVQFSIIGGYMYKNLDRADNKEINESTNEQYLSLYVNFLKTGLPKLHDYVKVKVADIVTNIDLKQKLSVQNLQEIFWSIQTSINTEEFIRNIPNFLVIDDQIEKTSDPILKQIYDETADVLSTKELTSHCVNSLLNSGFMYAIDQLLHAFTESAADKHPNREEPLKFFSLPIVKMLPVIHNTIKMKENKVWLKNLILSDKLQILAANVYESFC